ncbi:MAG TPA: alpha/beta hydrolase-fold protein [Pyrinomonadaceae bacterium]|nr:alpha/beta hydrolase-fold protein [Pyrinomonadaceae bacterium]
MLVPTPTSQTDCAAPPVPDGEFRKHPRFRSKFLPTARDVLVYLPPGYEREAPRRYPVLYLHDGQNLFDGATAYIPGQDWRVGQTAGALIREQAIEPVIVVGIYNTGHARVEEYTPSTCPRLKVGGKADLYGRLIVDELKPFIDSHYRTLAGACDTGLGGSSLGGLVTAYLGLRHPGVFGKLAVVSPSVWWDGRRILNDVKSLESKTGARIWLDMGTEEGPRAVNDARLLRDALLAKGWNLDRDLRYHEAHGARHTETAWAQRVDPILRYLYPKQ